MSWKDWVNESVDFYTDRIKEINQKLAEKNLSQEQRRSLESEKIMLSKERGRWKKIQKELN